MNQNTERAFKAFAPTWPTYLADSEPAARKAWFGLDDDERAAAVESAVRYVEGVKQIQKPPCSLGVYLREKRWTKLDAPKPASDQPTKLKPYGKMWMAHRMALLGERPRTWKVTGFQQRAIADGKGHLFTDARHAAQYPLVARLDADAAGGKSAWLRAGVTPPDASGFVQIRVGDDRWLAWEAWHADSDLPWIKPPAHIEFVWIKSVLPTLEQATPEPIGEASAPPQARREREVPARISREGKQ